MSFEDIVEFLKVDELVAETRYNGIQQLRDEPFLEDIALLLYIMCLLFKLNEVLLDDIGQRLYVLLVYLIGFLCLDQISHKGTEELGQGEGDRVLDEVVLVFEDREADIKELLSQPFADLHNRRRACTLLS